MIKVKQPKHKFRIDNPADEDWSDDHQSPSKPYYLNNVNNDGKYLHLILSLTDLLYSKILIILYSSYPFFLLDF